MKSLLALLSLPLACAGLSACVELDAPIETGVVEQEQIMLNQLALQAVLLNALTGTPDSLTELVSNPLSDDYFDADLPQGAITGQNLHDPLAQTFMTYLVRCALSETDTPVTWTDPFKVEGEEGKVVVFHGQAGLCSDWATQAPSGACLELVSACLLTTENAFDTSVAISHRGIDLNGDALPLAAQVEVGRFDIDGQPIPSFEDCPSDENGATRDCGWSKEDSLVGTCHPGDLMELSCQQGSSIGVARVCKGYRGCDDASLERLASADEFCGNDTEITFTCPSHGTYSLMLGGEYSDDLDVPLAVADSGSYPAAEAEVFDIREGAFFGDLLTPSLNSTPVALSYVTNTGQIVRNVQAGTGGTPLNESMWACHDKHFTEGDAYMNERICATVTDDQNVQAYLCAARIIGQCNEKAEGTLTNVCASFDAGSVKGDGDFGSCTDTTPTVWDRPITVFLDHPCDLIEDPDLCAYGRRPPPPSGANQPR
ncbi:hypothetical protein [Haliangium ochraceum]|uniref:Putative lipoprotein n=1 Tax=Haliangium ochraceum (strain DSM 14365 / JCM 11303 / SMP-2) TaxID=502025 RepID=D0LXV0_HALO1|nr:hypothetical protein [Haliangium ochraceum]ACY14305.1 putative lipoprotein [Haliangium ochraceum DSM 14365]